MRKTFIIPVAPQTIEERIELQQWAKQHQENLNKPRSIYEDDGVSIDTALDILIPSKK